MRAVAPGQPNVEREPGIRLFSSAADAPRRRRANDILVLGVSSTVLVLFLALHDSSPGPVDRGLADALAAWAPGILTPVWDAALTLLAFWPAGLVVVALLSHGRLSLVRDGVVAAALAVGITWVVCEVTDVAWPGVSVLRPTGALDFPLVELGVAAAVVIAFGPSLGRTLRRASKLVLLAGAIGAVAMATTRPSGAVVGLLVGIVAGRAVLVALGSPGGVPTAGQIRDSLRDLGVDVDDVVPAEGQIAGTYLVRAEDADGLLDISVCGRDARDTAVAATLWRQAWYRPDGHRATSSRLHQVEQEAFVTLLARAAGVEVPVVVTAGMARTDDALLVTRPVGRAIASASDGAVDLDALWRLVNDLHAAGIVHGSLDAGSVGTTDDGRPCLVRMAGATTSVTALDRHTDEMQVLALTASLVGIDRAVESARRALGDDGLAALLPYLQPALLTKGARSGGGDDLLDEIAAGVTAATGVERPDLIRLRRVTWGSALQAGLLVLAGYALVVGLGSLDLAAVWDDLVDASVPLLIAAFVAAQLPRPLQAISTQGASLTDLPMGPLAALQLAISYVNLAVPSAAGRLAITIRFFQKVGIDRTTAVSIGAIDSAAGFAVQIAILLFVAVTGASEVSLDVLDADVQLSTVIIWVAVGAAAVVALVLLLAPALRRWLHERLQPAYVSLRVLRRPAKVVRLFGGNIASQVAFAAALALCVEAVGAEVAFIDVLMANTLVSLFAGILPVPGGIGVTEAGLTAALTVAGVPQETALAAVIIYRVWSFYLPPVWGFFAMRWLQRRSFL